LFAANCRISVDLPTCRAPLKTSGLRRRDRYHSFKWCSAWRKITNNYPFFTIKTIKTKVSLSIIFIN